jgi:hypothetical protein
MGMELSKLETTLSVKFLEKGSTSDYLMIIAKVFESLFENGNTDRKLEVG